MNWLVFNYVSRFFCCFVISSWAVIEQIFLASRNKSLNVFLSQAFLISARVFLCCFCVRVGKYENIFKRSIHNILGKKILISYAQNKNISYDGQKIRRDTDKFFRMVDQGNAATLEAQLWEWDFLDDQNLYGKALTFLCKMKLTFCLFISLCN